MSRADLRLVRGWLRTPDVRRWWGDPDEQLALIAGDLDDPRMSLSIVALDGVPFAYVQAYAPHDWAMHHFASLPAGSRGIDQFIGIPAMSGRGHGSAFIALHVAALLRAGAPVVATDPHPDNARAIRAYEKAGFARGERRDTAWGPALLMYRYANSASSGTSSASASAQS